MDNIEELKQEYAELLRRQTEIYSIIVNNTRDFNRNQIDRIYDELKSVNSRIDYLGPIVATSIIDDGEIELKTTGDTNSPWNEYLIYLKGTQTCVGNITYRGYHISDYFGDIGYNIGEEFNGNGYAYKALCLVSNILAEKNIPDFWITCSDSNVASLKTIRKYGEIHEETKDNHLMFFECGTRVLSKKTTNKL